MNSTATTLERLGRAHVGRRRLKWESCQDSEAAWPDGGGPSTFHVLVDFTAAASANARNITDTVHDTDGSLVTKAGAELSTSRR